MDFGLVDFMGIRFLSLGLNFRLLNPRFPISRCMKLGLEGLRLVSVEFVEVESVKSEGF